MKKLITSIAFILTFTTLFAQPVLYSDSLHTGMSFNLYDLSNVNVANIITSGGGVTWDISAAVATLAGTAEFLAIAATPYALQYPAANCAYKFTPTGGSDVYSLFNLSGTVLEEVANNVGTPNPVSFTDYRTALVFPFTFNSNTSDTYQKTGQSQKMISNNYDAYGTLMTNPTSYSNIVRNSISDDGNSSALWYSTTPLMPLFQASSSGFTLWQFTAASGLSELSSNSLFDMYPNPATNELKIINKALIANIEIYDITGQLMFSTTQSIIDISPLKAGVYYLKAYSGKSSVAQKFVKE